MSVRVTNRQLETVLCMSTAQHQRQGPVLKKKRTSFRPFDCTPSVLNCTVWKKKSNIKFNIWPAVSKKRRRRQRLDMTRIDPSLSEKKKKKKTKAFFSFGVKIFWRKKRERRTDGNRLNGHAATPLSESRYDTTRNGETSSV